jgi:hypothetical protein
MENNFDFGFLRSHNGINQAIADNGRRMRAAADAQAMMPSLLSGQATFNALSTAVDDLLKKAPQDCDVLVRIHSLIVENVRFIAPHTFFCEGYNQEGHPSSLVCHFTQLIAEVVFLPKKGNSRVITGFANVPA